MRARHLGVLERAPGTARWDGRAWPQERAAGITVPAWIPGQLHLLTVVTGMCASLTSQKCGADKNLTEEVRK